jgi:biotin carboxyl carrier protein
MPNAWTRASGRALRPLTLVALGLLALTVTVPEEPQGQPGDLWRIASVPEVAVPVWLVAGVSQATTTTPDVAPFRLPSHPQRPHKLALPAASAQRAGELMDALGLDHERTIAPADLHAAAAALGVEVAEIPSPGDVEQMLEAHRQGAIPALRKGGVTIADGASEDDLRRVARFLGLDVGERLRPGDVERMVSLASEPTPVFASTGGVHIHAPSRHVVLVGFHQASYRVARQLKAHDRVPMRTLPSRGRVTGTRSAADVSVEAGTQVLAPVTGRVVEVKRYALYGRYADARIRLRPSQNPDMLVTILHVTGPTVRVGDRIKGGETIIAKQATKFPFASQIDRFAGSYPHAHIEVRRR